MCGQGRQPAVGSGGIRPGGSGPDPGSGRWQRKIVNIGVTSSLNTLNPLLMDGVEVNKYATGLMFLPLMELNADMEFEGMLADSITAEDETIFWYTLTIRRCGLTVSR